MTKEMSRFVMETNANLAMLEGHIRELRAEVHALKQPTERRQETVFARPASIFDRVEELKGRYVQS